jgi:hypothetical protein
MPSPANTLADFETEDERSFPVRSTIEWILRAISIIVLVFLIWQAFHLLRQRPTGRAEGEAIEDALVRWSTRESPQQIHVAFDSVPSPEYRDWLAAFPAAGTQKSWEGATLQPSAVTVEPVADPKGSVRIWVAAPSGATVTVSDTLGIIDSVNVTTGGGVITAPNAEGLIRATVGGTSASAELRDSLKVKPVLVLGIASWEGKFIMASLEEHGWKVDARFQVTPIGKGVVVQGPPEPKIDTANYAAVIVLDSSAAKYAGAITTYVRQGGGLIVTGYAAPLAAFSSLVPAGNVVVPDMLMEDVPESDSLAPRQVLQLAPLRQLKPTAIAIESRGNDVAAAAWRVGQGRVLQVGYLDTWQWRMGGKGETVTPYRTWWSTMVSSIAYAPRYPRTAANAVEPTPMASLVSILGAPESKAAEESSFLDDPRLLPFLFGLLMATLLAEWASRRLRGRP